MTRLNLFIFAFLTVSFQASALLGQVVFFSDYQLALEAMKERGKPLLYKICNDGNRKCQKLSEEVLSDPEIADLININFVPLRLDPQVDREIVHPFEVTKYPTLIVVGTSGQLLDRYDGYKEQKETEKFIKTIARNASGLTDMRKEYNSRRDDTQFLKEYYKSLKASGFGSDAQRLIPHFFSNTSRIEKREDYDFVFSSADHYRSQSFAYVLDHLTEFDSIYGKTVVSDRLMNALVMNLPLERQMDLRYIERRMSTVFRNVNTSRFKDAFIVNYFSRIDGRDTVQWYVESGMRRLEDLDCSPMPDFNDLMVTLMLNSSSEEDLSKLESAARACFAKTQDINTLDLLSVIMYKKGEREEALRIVQQASELAATMKMKFKSSLNYFREIGFIK